jgi:enoyl-CoA hydratase/carnithine racemase
MLNNITKNYDFINQHQVVWFQGAGGKAFCAGGDVKILF